MATAYINGRFYTVDERNPWAESVLVEDGVFTLVGTEEQVRAAAPKGTDFVGGTEQELVDMGRGRTAEDPWLARNLQAESRRGPTSNSAHALSAAPGGRLRLGLPKLSCISVLDSPLRPPTKSA